MSHNPLKTELKAKAANLKRARSRRTRLVSEVRWHDKFDRGRAERALEADRARSASLEEAHRRVAQEVAAAEQESKGLERSTRLGLSPAHWFSRERREAKVQLERHRRKLVELRARKAGLGRELATIQSSLDEKRAQVVRFDGFRADEATAEIARLDEEIALLQLEHDDLSERAQRLEELLREPVEVLQDLKGQEEQTKRALGKLRAAVEAYERNIDRADSFDRQLSEAGNAYERAKIHEECEELLGHGSPRAAISDLRRKATQTKREIATAERQLEALSRNVAKARNRVANVVARGTRDIRALVVDGSNLCYQSGTFIGLAALRPLCRRLADDFEVTLVFDASIRRKLGGMSDNRLRALFDGLTVHIVATKAKADETILAAAEDRFVFVLSNDRFSEYGDKPAVRDGRLIRHEIINGRVLLHDLDIYVPFAESAPF